MAHSKRGSNHSVKVPTLDDWIKAKKRSHKKMAKLPFIQKIRILEEMQKTAAEINGTRK